MEGFYLFIILTMVLSAEPEPQVKLRSVVVMLIFFSFWLFLNMLNMETAYESIHLSILFHEVV